MCGWDVVCANMHTDMNIHISAVSRFTNPPGVHKRALPGREKQPGPSDVRISWRLHYTLM